MISIELYRSHNGNVKGFRVEGHAGMAEKGWDTVCAGVSVLAQTAVLGLHRYLGLQPKVSRHDGYLSCMLTDQEIEEHTVQAVLETMVIGLKEIAGQFPEYVSVEEHRR